MPVRAGGPRARASGRRGLALVILLCAQLMVILDATVVNIALPQIQHGLHFSATSLSWVMNGYTLTFGGLLLLGGRAGDILGRRRMFIAGDRRCSPWPRWPAGWPTRPGCCWPPGPRKASAARWPHRRCWPLIIGSFSEGRERTRALAIYTAVITRRQRRSAWCSGA